MTKQTHSSGTVWEEMAGYSRAVRVGDRILVAGTTAIVLIAVTIVSFMPARRIARLNPTDAIKGKLP